MVTGFDITKIKALLPHHYPFLLVDKVIAYKANVSMTAIKNVTYNELFFQGHFPEKPIMPGVLILEAMAQTAGLLGFESVGGRPDNVICYLVGIDKAKFNRPVVLGDQLIIEVQFSKKKSNVWIYECQSYVAFELVASAEIRYATKVYGVE
jgi:3-hydroxyacyl-[acyl-carrier-protein] dehydratase